MKLIVRIASAFLTLVSVQTFATDCYVRAQVLSTQSKARIVLNVVRMDIPYFSPDNARMQLNQPEADNLQAQTLAYAKANAKCAEGSADTSAGFDKVSLS